MNEFHNWSEEEEQELKDLFNLGQMNMHDLAQTIKVWKVIGKDQTLGQETTGINFDINGQVVQHTTSETSVLKCGCVVQERQVIIECSYSKELICSSHITYCQKCRKPVWIHHSTTFRENTYCKDCVAKVLALTIPNLLWLIIKTIIVGMCGKKLEEKKTTTTISPPQPTGGFDAQQLSQYAQSQQTPPQLSRYSSSDSQGRKTGWDL